MIMISNFIFNFIVSFFAWITNNRYLFSTVAKAELVAKLVILGIISPLTSFLLAFRAVVVAKLVILGIISPLTSFLLALRAAVVAKLAKLGISPLTSFILALRVLYFSNCFN